tara:strand:- start:9162 stop:9326 length:165 start_codon:yes stop_codon:yes gene_type:complete
MTENQAVMIFYLDKKFEEGGNIIAYESIDSSKVESWTKILNEKKIEYEIFDYNK